ncbi:MAG: flagellar motor protein MotB [Candidatus Omnitrophota bacterium]
MREFKILFVIASVAWLAGCTVVFQGGRVSDKAKINELSQELDELKEAKHILDKRLSQEVRDKNVKLKMMEKGLVITFLADILFDSGKSKIRTEAEPILDKVAAVLVEDVPELKVGIEGHTDNEPIKFSNWKSNWELSTARALSVLHYLIDQRKISPERLSAVGYGEYYPVADNVSKENSKLNRRVEIVILPRSHRIKELPKAPQGSVPNLIEENLK